VARRTRLTGVRGGSYGGAIARCESAEGDSLDDLSRQNRWDQSRGRSPSLLIHSGRKARFPRCMSWSLSADGDYRYESLFSGGMDWICCRINIKKGEKKYQTQSNCIGSLKLCGTAMPQTDQNADWTYDIGNGRRDQPSVTVCRKGESRGKRDVGSKRYPCWPRKKAGVWG